MKPGILQQLMLYRYRYAVGYAILALFAVATIFWQLTTLGPGLHTNELDSAITSEGWKLSGFKDTGAQVVNLPYTILQKGSVTVFGPSTFSIRLPSALIALATSLLFFLLMRRLYKAHVAITASLLFVTSSWYIPFSHFGTAEIMIPFVWLLIIYPFVRLVRLDEPPIVWAGIAAFGLVLAAYTPYGLYAPLIVAIVCLIHPETRRSLGFMNSQQLLLGLAILVPLLLPLLWGIYKSPSQLWELTGLTAQIPSVMDFGKNIAATVWALVWSAPPLPEFRLANTPLLALGGAMLLAAGAYRAIRDWRSIRTQFIIVSLVVLIILMGIKPRASYLPLLIPLYLVIASGVTVLFREWYRLFPRNPYARSFGLIPIVILLTAIVGFHYQRYFLAWANASETYKVYSDDFTLAKQQIRKHNSLVIVVPQNEVKYYELLKKRHTSIIVTTTTANTTLNQALLISHAIAAVPATEDRPLRPVVNDDSEYALRFWLAAAPK